MKPIVAPFAACAACVLSLVAISPREAAAQDALPPLPASQPAPAQPSTPAAAPLPPPPPPPPSSAPPPVIVAEPAANDGSEVPQEKGAAPVANHGFQLHAGLGYSQPFGRISNNDGAMSDFSTGQFMLLDLGVGGKIGRHFYIGAYLSVAGGGVAGSGCNSCSSASVHLGIEGEYFFRPDARWDPWIGYGLGVEGLSAGSDQATITYTGFEFARLTAGVDARLSRAFGMGPYLGFSFARYTDRDVQVGSADVKSNIENRTVHGWFTLGLRFVIFP